jgi:hypothetical protein
MVVLAVLAAGFVASSTVFVDLPLRTLGRFTADVGAVVSTTMLVALAAHRAGGRTFVAALFALTAAAAAVVSDLSWLLAGAAAFTAYAGAVLAVVATRPAQRTSAVLREYLGAVVVAVMAGVGAAAYRAPLHSTMLTDAVSIAALLTMLWLAWRLGGGFAGLGTRGIATIGGTFGVILAGFAYTEALRRWGTPEVIDSLSQAEQRAVDLLGALPSPLGALVGFPALVWGLATRAQLRQGWWVCAFGAVGTAWAATAIPAPDADLQEVLLSLAYSVAIGLIIGLILWRIDQALTGPRGRRARQAERAQPLRPEPPRTRPLL